MSDLLDRVEKLGWSIEGLLPDNSDIRRTSGGVHISPCPVCGHNGCFVLFNGGKRWWCFSSSHSGGGDVINLYADIHAVNVSDASKQMLGLSVTQFQKHFKPMRDRINAEMSKAKSKQKRVITTKEFTDYLGNVSDKKHLQTYSRALMWGFDSTVMHDVGIMQDYRGRSGFVMADTDKDGNCTGPWSIKYADNMSPKSRTHVKKFGLGVGAFRLNSHKGLYNAVFDRGTEIVICGGMKDLLSVRMLGYQAVGLDGEGCLTSDVVALAEYCRAPVVFFLDADEPGQKATMKHIEKLSPTVKFLSSVKHKDHWWPLGKDVTDYRCNGVRDREIRAAIADACYAAKQK